MSNFEINLRLVQKLPIYKGHIYKGHTVYKGHFNISYNTICLKVWNIFQTTEHNQSNLGSFYWPKNIK